MFSVSGLKSGPDLYAVLRVGIRNWFYSTKSQEMFWPEPRQPVTSIVKVSIRRLRTRSVPES